MLEQAIWAGDLDGANYLSALVPELIHEERVDQFGLLSYRLLADHQYETAFELARWASELTVDAEVAAGRRAVPAHHLERAGKADEALAILLTDWEKGHRLALAADRISLIAKRSGDIELAKRVLEEILEMPDSELNGKPAHEIFERRLAKLGS